MPSPYIAYLGLLFLIPHAAVAATPSCKVRLRDLTVQARYFDILKDAELLKPDLSPEEASFALDLVKAIETGSGMNSIESRLIDQSRELLDGFLTRMEKFVASADSSQVRYRKPILLAVERVGKLRKAIRSAIEEQGLLHILLEKGKFPRHLTLEEAAVTHEVHAWIKSGIRPNGFKSKLHRQSRDFLENLLAQMERFKLYSQSIDTGVIAEAVKRTTELQAEIMERSG